MRGCHVANIAACTIAALSLTAGLASDAGAQTCQIEREIKFSGYD